ncbi:bile acid:sodium symporter family protein [Ammoniphilus sp. 3BR4]|uniref:bile acid:sodium symporter family protein n=1 Tax=Ammoniphilus sp. 3BR4 TaxID=3158265 RepID=UPI003467AE10
MGRWNWVQSVVTKPMPIWIVGCSLMAYGIPGLFSDLHRYTGLALAFILFAMGMSLKTDSILRVIKRPKALFAGVFLKWTVTLGVSVFIAGLVFGDQPDIAAGMILAGAVPSGTSANLYTFMANGATALSISMAAIDTFVGPVLTPVILKATAGKWIVVEFLPLFKKMVYIVLLPILAGLAVQWKWGKQAEKVRPVIPLFSALCLFIVVLAVVSQSQPILSENKGLLPLIAISVIFQVSVPMLAGYVLSKWLRFREEECRAILFETGICNTALAALLAMDHISASAAVPAVANMVANLSIGAYVAEKLGKRVPEGDSQQLKSQVM